MNFLDLVRIANKRTALARAQHLLMEGVGSKAADSGSQIAPASNSARPRVTWSNAGGPIEGGQDAS